MLSFFTFILQFELFVKSVRNLKIKNQRIPFLAPADFFIDTIPRRVQVECIPPSNQLVHESSRRWVFQTQKM